MLKGRIRGKITGIYDRISHRVQARRHMKAQRLSMSIYLALDIELGRILGDKLDRHFTVSVRPSVMDGYNVSVTSSTDIGYYLYYGTRPHVIVGSKPMPIYPDRGIFAWRVNHPGQKALRPDIEAAIESAIYKALVATD